MQSRKVRRKILAACALIGAMVLTGTHAPAEQLTTWSWHVETVDGPANFPSIVTDTQGNVHLAYWSQEQNHTGVKYAFRDAVQGRWYSMFVTSTGPAVTGIGLDASQNPHLCFTNGAVFYLAFDGKKWSGQEIAPNSGTRSYDCSVAVDNEGKPYVTWYHEFTPAGTLYGHFKCAALQEGKWLVRTVDFDNQTGKWNSLALDAHGYPHVTYDSWDKGAMKYASWDGKEWNIKVIASGITDPGDGSAHGMGSSLVMGPDGMPRVSYVAFSRNIAGNAFLMYAHESGGKWTTQRVVPLISLGSWQGVRTSLALDRDGFPHISYEDAGAIKHAYWNGRTWKVQVIATSGADPYPNNAIAIAPDNTIFISYRDPEDGSLKVAVAKQIKVQNEAKK